VIADALKLAIAADPDDDLPRLAYADWLEEQGDERDRQRAAFIRVQLQLARLPSEAPERQALRARERLLLEAHGPGWLRELPPWARGRAQFHRGFVVAVRFRVQVFVVRPEEIEPSHGGLAGPQLRLTTPVRTQEPSAVVLMELPDLLARAVSIFAHASGNGPASDLGMRVCVLGNPCRNATTVYQPTSRVRVVPVVFLQVRRDNGAPTKRRAVLGPLSVRLDAGRAAAFEWLAWGAQKATT
jgi:uncharacterized protein (TIGR02996 family)